MKKHATTSLVWTERFLLPLAVATVATGFSFYVPVSALFLASRGLSLQDIFLLESILLGSILVTEIPSGLVSDRVNRRWIILTGFILNAVAEVLFAVGHSFGIFAASFMFSGFGIAMLTGVQDAYIYDSLREHADKLSVGVWGHLSSLELGAGVLGSISGGLLATQDVSYPAFASAGCAILAASAVAFLPNQHPQGKRSKNSETTWLSFKRAAELLFTSPLLLYTAVASSASFVMFNAVFTINQPLFQATAVPVAFWGFIGATAQLLAAVYNHFAGSIVDSFGRKTSLLLAQGYGICGFVLMAVPHPVAVIAGFILTVLGMNARGPIIRAVANKVIPVHRRATVLNIASTVGSLVGIAMNPVIGWGAETNSRNTVVIIAVVLTLMALAWIPIANRYLTEDRAEQCVR